MNENGRARIFSTVGSPRVAKPCTTPENTWIWYVAFISAKISSARWRDSVGNAGSVSANESLARIGCFSNRPISHRHKTLGEVLWEIISKVHGCSE